MKSRFKSRKSKIILAFISAGIIVTAGFGIYFIYAQNPHLQLTEVNFSINYSGNYSNYLNPLLMNSTGGPVKDINLVSHRLYVNDGKWYFQIPITFGFNKSSTLYNNYSKSKYDLGNSVVIQSIAVSGGAFSLTSWNYQGENPMPINPTSNISDETILIFQMNSNSYKGPLNLTINADSPAYNVILIRPNVRVIENGTGGADVKLFAGTGPDFGLSLGTNEYGFTSEDSIHFSSISLYSKSDFNITGIAVDYPFSIVNKTLGNSYNGGNGTYTASVSAEIISSETSFDGWLNLTIYVKSY